MYFWIFSCIKLFVKTHIYNFDPLFYFKCSEKYVQCILNTFNTVMLNIIFIVINISHYVSAHKIQCRLNYIFYVSVENLFLTRIKLSVLLVIEWYLNTCIWSGIAFALHMFAYQIIKFIWLTFRGKNSAII